MVGTKVTFFDGGAEVRVGEAANEYELTIQRAVIFIASTLESDSIFPEKGSDILKDGLTGLLYNDTSTEQQASLLSMRVFDFLKDTEVVPMKDPLVRVVLKPTFESLQYVILDLHMYYQSGKVQQKRSYFNT